MERRPLTPDGQEPPTKRARLSEVMQSRLREASAARARRSTSATPPLPSYTGIGQGQSVLSFFPADDPRQDGAQQRRVDPSNPASAADPTDPLVLLDEGGEPHVYTPQANGLLYDQFMQPRPGQIEPFDALTMANEFERRARLERNPDYQFIKGLAGRMNKSPEELLDPANLLQMRAFERELHAELAQERKKREISLSEREKLASKLASTVDGKEADLRQLEKLQHAFEPTVQRWSWLASATGFPVLRATDANSSEDPSVFGWAGSYTEPLPFWLLTRTMWVNYDFVTKKAATIENLVSLFHDISDDDLFWHWRDNKAAPWLATIYDDFWQLVNQPTASLVPLYTTERMRFMLASYLLFRDTILVDALGLRPDPRFHDRRVIEKLQHPRNIYHRQQNETVPGLVRRVVDKIFALVKSRATESSYRGDGEEASAIEPRLPLLDKPPETLWEPLYESVEKSLGSKASHRAVDALFPALTWSKLWHFFGWITATYGSEKVLDMFWDSLMKQYRETKKSDFPLDPHAEEHTCPLLQVTSSDESSKWQVLRKELWPSVVHAKGKNTNFLDGPLRISKSLTSLEFSWTRDTGYFMKISLRDCPAAILNLFTLTPRNADAGTDEVERIYTLVTYACCVAIITRPQGLLTLLLNLSASLSARAGLARRVDSFDAQTIAALTPTRDLLRQLSELNAEETNPATQNPNLTMWKMGMAFSREWIRSTLSDATRLRSQRMKYEVSTETGVGEFNVFDEATKQVIPPATPTPTLFVDLPFERIYLGMYYSKPVGNYDQRDNAFQDDYSAMRTRRTAEGKSVVLDNWLEFAQQEGARIDARVAADAPRRYMEAARLNWGGVARSLNGRFVNEIVNTFENIDLGVYSPCTKYAIHSTLRIFEIMCYFCGTFYPAVHATVRADVTATHKELDEVSRDLTALARPNMNRAVGAAKAAGLDLHVPSRAWSMLPMVMGKMMLAAKVVAALDDAVVAIANSRYLPGMRGVPLDVLTGNTLDHDRDAFIDMDASDGQAVHALVNAMQKYVASIMNNADQRFPAQYNTVRQNQMALTDAFYAPKEFHRFQARLIRPAYADHGAAWSVHWAKQ